MTVRIATIEGSGAVRHMQLRSELNANIEQVWQALTNVEQLAQWWPDWRPGGVMEHHEGGRIRIDDGTWLDGLIKVWAPPHILAFSWREDDLRADWLESHSRSLTTFQLFNRSAEECTLLVSQFAPVGAVVGGTAGWHYFAGERLARLLTNQPFDDRPERFEELKQLYQELL